MIPVHPILVPVQTIKEKYMMNFYICSLIFSYLILFSSIYYSRNEQTQPTRGEVILVFIMLLVPLLNLAIDAILLYAALESTGILKKYLYMVF